MKLMFARSIQLKTVNKLKKAGFTAKLVGKKVKIDVGNKTKSVDMENEGSIDSLIDRLKAMFRPEEAIYDEPPDTAVLQKSGQFPEEKLPEGYSQYILPATAKPNISRIKQWVREIKLQGKTNEDLLNEYNQLKGTNLSDTITASQKKDLIDSTAYKISRKIWYVGRKPADMTNSDWDEMTKNMRPAEGSYGDNDTWNNFPYTKDYQYGSSS
jgi:hypothetical protein